MKGGLAGAWLVAVGIVSWRQIHGTGLPPVPGRLLAVTGLFGLLAITGDVFPASARFLTVGAWGLDVAGVLRLWPAGLGGEVGQVATSGTVSAPAAKTSTTGG